MRRVIQDLHESIKDKQVDDISKIVAWHWPEVNSAEDLERYYKLYHDSEDFAIKHPFEIIRLNLCDPVPPGVFEYNVFFSDIDGKLYDSVGISMI